MYLGCRSARVLLWVMLRNLYPILQVLLLEQCERVPLIHGNCVLQRHPDIWWNCLERRSTTRKVEPQEGRLVLCARCPHRCLFGCGKR